MHVKKYYGDETEPRFDLVFSLKDDELIAKDPKTLEPVPYPSELDDHAIFAIKQNLQGIESGKAVIAKLGSQQHANPNKDIQTFVEGCVYGIGYISGDDQRSVHLKVHYIAA